MDKKSYEAISYLASVMDKFELRLMIMEKFIADIHAEVVKPIYERKFSDDEVHESLSKSDINNELNGLIDSRSFDAET